ncbi:radical SAM protein [Paenibacillus macerans]|uniref:radical SAM/SPASM domain-containing protein n=1 Tax=Paenibacillus macerans TaxID=44252 RepID=UPI002E1C8761|nr:radical SAM protein [Paenibacillus macerans]
MDFQSKFGDTVVLGLDFSPEFVQEAMKENRMLVLDMDFTPNCNLHCFYCDRTPDRLNKSNMPKELTFEQRKKIISEAKELGICAIGIVGAGEPMLDPHFWELLTYIHEQDIIPLVYASGWEIRELKTVQRLKALNASVMLKYNSADVNVADKMTGVRGYGSHVKKVLQWLLECGFNESIPTRLGINVVATHITMDKQAFYDLFRWSRINNVYMHGQSLIPEGNANNEKITLNKEQAMELLYETARIDEDEFNIHYEVVPPIVGGFRCRKVNVGMFVNMYGEVWDCNGSGRKLGVWKEDELEKIWNSNRARRIRKPVQEGFCLIRERWWGRVQVNSNPNMEGFE